MASYWSTVKAELKRLVEQTGDYRDVQVRRSRLGVSLPCPRRDRLGTVYLAAERKEFELNLKISLATARPGGKLNVGIITFQVDQDRVKYHACHTASFEQDDPVGAFRYVKARLAYVDRNARRRRLRQVNRLLDELLA